jgi:hypothetical protein
MFRLMLPLFALAVLIAIGGSSCHDHHPRGDGGDMSQQKQEEPRSPTGGGGGY